ncbi:MAG: transglutaminase domain-containing protein, partial [Calditrichaeota bacterium]|nr:transglutaminase domain-containing protein [Calditrichota bacterium]
MAYDATFGNSDYFKLSDYRFLLANLPLADLTCLEAEDLIENVNLARNALDRMPWGASIPPDLYDHFILPHRVSQEPFVKWRRLFLDELAPRVEGLSMPEAILEVNHWCHEKATYRPTDGRDQDPLTTIRSGYGRCEEEMILTICALRAVAIPARQCYTPYWAHSDDNHAWVEAWADGQWYYLGACEPAQSLNSAWFSSPAQRAILIISTAYGDYTGDEPVLRRYGRSTAINSTSVYGPVKQLQVVLLDRKGRTLPGAKAVFSLWNYGTLMPATALTSDANGHLTLISGIGDWFVAVQVNERMAFAHVEGSTESLTLRLTAKEPDDWSGGFCYQPPPAASAPSADIISAEGEARGIISPEVRERADSLFRTRLTREDSLRETCLWPLRPNFGDDPGSVYLKPDSARFWSDPAFASVDDTLRDVLLQRLLDARGNWLAIYDFLNGKGREGADPAPSFDPLRWEVVKRLTPKDLLDWPGEPYEVTTTLDLASDDGHLKSHLASLDSAARERFLDFVLPVRIDDEPASGRRERSQLASFLRKE